MDFFFVLHISGIIFRGEFDGRCGKCWSMSFLKVESVIYIEDQFFQGEFDGCCGKCWSMPFFGRPTVSYMIEDYFHGDIIVGCCERHRPAFATATIKFSLKNDPRSYITLSTFQKRHRPAFATATIKFSSKMIPRCAIQKRKSYLNQNIPSHRHTVLFEMCCRTHIWVPPTLTHTGLMCGGYSVVLSTKSILKARVQSCRSIYLLQILMQTLHTGKLTIKKPPLCNHVTQRNLFMSFEHKKPPICGK